MNKYTGTVDFKLGSKSAKLVYDWRAISELKSKYGKDIFTGLYLADPNIVADMLAVGLKGSGITLDEILDFSPPIIPTVNAIDLALTYSYYGPEGKKDEKDPGAKKKPTAR